MDDREQKILDFMSDDDYVPMKAKEIAMLMRVPKNEYHDFLELIGKLELELKIEKNRKNRYKISKKTYYDGFYRKNQKGFGFVKLEDREDEIYISKENSLNALNGDHVLIEIIEEENKIKRAEGKIIRILKHEKDTIVGTFKYNTNFGFVILIKIFEQIYLFQKRILEKQEITIKYWLELQNILKKEKKQKER